MNLDLNAHKLYPKSEKIPKSKISYLCRAINIQHLWWWLKYSQVTSDNSKLFIFNFFFKRNDNLGLVYCLLTLSESKSMKHHTTITQPELDVFLFLSQILYQIKILNHPLDEFRFCIHTALLPATG